jgi:hypothetical protein
MILTISGSGFPLTASSVMGMAQIHGTTQVLTTIRVGRSRALTKIWIARFVMQVAIHCPGIVTVAILRIMTVPEIRITERQVSLQLVKTVTFPHMFIGLKLSSTINFL